MPLYWYLTDIRMKSLYRIMLYVETLYMRNIAWWYLKSLRYSKHQYLILSGRLIETDAKLRK